MDPEIDNRPVRWYINNDQVVSGRVLCPAITRGEHAIWILETNSGAAVLNSQYGFENTYETESAARAALVAILSERIESTSRKLALVCAGK